MPSPHDHAETTPEALAGLIPRADEVRLRLAVNITEGDLLRALLKLAERRERESERLAYIAHAEARPA
jgi:hypothetical protein